MRTTRTHTVYWSEDQVEPLLAEIAKLRADFEERKPYIDSESGAAMEARLVLLETAAGLCGDVAG